MKGSNMSDNSGEENPQVYVPAKYGMEDLVSRLYTMVDAWDGRKRVVQGIVWFLIACVLMVAATLPLPDFLNFVRPIVGIPAGVILFSLIISIIHVTSLRDKKLFLLRENYPQSRRVPVALVGLAILVFLTVASSSWLPSGCAGAILIAGVLGVVNIIRRTPYESQLALQGLIDPREYVEKEFVDDENYFSDDIEDEEDDGSQDTRRRI